MSTNEEMKEFEMKEEDYEMDAADTDTGDVELTDGSLANDHIIPHRHQLAQIDQHYPPPNQPTHPESFHSVGQKRRRLNEPESATVTVKSTQTAASLYRDALHSIFRFLMLREFVRTCVINKTYYSAGQQMRSRKDYLWCRQPLFLLVQSPLRHHITKLNLYTQYLDPNGLLLLQMTMAHLEELQFEIRLTKADLIKYSSPICFAIPKQLLSLHLRIHFRSGCDLTTATDARTYITGCMKQIAVQSTRLVKLDFGLFAAQGEMDFPSAELRTISTLTALTLSHQISMDQQIDFIKSLPSLRFWQRRNVLSPELLQRLADGPNGPPKLEDISELDQESEVVDEAMAEQLKRLVTLTKIDITMSLTDPTKLLPHFPRLSILSLYCEESVDVNHLVTALSTCIRLTELTLQHTILTGFNVAQFITHLSSLVKLVFYGCEALVSLEFLTTACKSLCHLTHFTIQESAEMPIIEYCHLDAISSSLESLTISHSSIGEFDPLTIGRWTPGSKEFKVKDWPKLKSFLLDQ